MVPRIAVSVSIFSPKCLSLFTLALVSGSLFREHLTGDKVALYHLFTACFGPLIPVLACRSHAAPTEHDPFGRRGPLCKPPTTACNARGCGAIAERLHPLEWVTFGWCGAVAARWSGDRRVEADSEEAIQSNRGYNSY